MTESTKNRPLAPWFTEAKLGIFIHWGIYAARGYGESWPIFNKDVSYETYMAQCADFTASRYDPEQWAKLFRKAGARYAVITTKHHDGVALWDTRQSDLNVVKKTPAARDVLTPWVKAMREADLKVGLYFSHLDWSHPDYPTLLPDEFDPKVHTNPYSYPRDGIAKPERWANFLKFHRAQLRELTRQYQPDLLWFDGDWTPDRKHWQFDKLVPQLRKQCPGVILNSRIGNFGDYATPEQGMPTVAPKGPFEFNMTMNDNWGYQPKDKNYKTHRQVIRIFSDIIGMGGNLLLNIAPKANGTIPAPQVKCLEALGAWIEKHREAVFGTVAGLPTGLFNGSCTLSKDRKTLYLFVHDRPWKDIAVKGIQTGVKKISVLGQRGSKLVHRKLGGASWANIPGILWIDLPSRLLDRRTTVVKVELEEPLQIWVSGGHAITEN